MLSFAPFKYRNVWAAKGGPIQRVENVGTLDIAGRPEVQVNAFLRPELSAGKMGHSVYGDADGSGSATSAAVAQHKAISEALERWAFLSVHNSGDAEKYGFTHDRSSNGMAAYPGLKRQAREAARSEAVERWALISWWAGHLEVSTAPLPGYADFGVVRILHGQPREVVILYRQTPTGIYAYGHAAAPNLEEAAAKAAVELARSEFVLARYRAKGALGNISNFMERRAVYFSSPEGFEEFSERVKTKPDKPAPLWTTIFDGEVPGPWSKWATVWRHCVEMPTHAFLKKEENFFFW